MAIELALVERDDTGKARIEASCPVVLPWKATCTREGKSLVANAIMLPTAMTAAQPAVRMGSEWELAIPITTINHAVGYGLQQLWNDRVGPALTSGKPNELLAVLSLFTTGNWAARKANAARAAAEEALVRAGVDPAVIQATLAAMKF
jgi:hypothetical protein